jgi:hypothetical protein
MFRAVSALSFLSIGAKRNGSPSWEAYTHNGSEHPGFEGGLEVRQP